MVNEFPTKLYPNTYMNAKLSLYVLALCLSISIASRGQQSLINDLMPQPVPKSPNAAAMDKYGDYQVSHFTGLPNISIPIFEATSGDLSVPITLSYHASGNRPTDVAGWVGLGWSLSTGGQVTRSVNGKPDEHSYYTHPLNAAPSNCSSHVYLQYATSNVLDTEPDVFSYSYPGGGGKFIFVNQGTYVNENSTAPIGPAYLFPYAPIVVKRVNDQKFQITDERGVLYRFGTSKQGATSMEQTNAFNGGNPTIAATTTWNLLDIISPNSNDSIKYTYQSIGTANRHDVAHTWLVTDLCNLYSGSCPPSTHLSAQSPLNTDSNVNQQGVHEMFFENGKIQFVLSSTFRADQTALKYLDKINVFELFNGTYSLKKIIDFTYSYFLDAVGSECCTQIRWGSGPGWGRTDRSKLYIHILLQYLFMECHYSRERAGLVAILQWGNE